MSTFGLTPDHDIDFQVEATFIMDTAEAALVALLSTEGISAGIALDGSLVRAVFTVVTEFLSLPAVNAYIEDYDLDPDYVGAGFIRSANGHVSDFTGELREAAGRFRIETYVVDGMAYATI